MKISIPRIILSLAFAFGLWLYVITSVSPGSTETFNNININRDGETVLEERGLMVTGISSTTVSLKLSGTRTDLSKVNSGNITAKIDLSKIYEPGNAIAFVPTISFPGDVPSNAFVIESKYPASIYVSVARRITKNVPVEVSWNGSAADGYMTDRENRQLDISEVTISGPESVVNTIAKAVIEVNLTDRRESISEDYTYILCDEAGEPVDAELITTNAQQIHLAVRVQRIKDLELTYTVTDGAGATSANLQVRMSTSTIRVAGSDAAIENLGDSLVIGNINLAEITKSTKLRFPINLPDGITNLTGFTDVELDLALKGLMTKEIQIESVTSTNVPEGMEADIITEVMTVVLRGPSEVISKLVADDVSVSVNFEGAQSGTDTYKAIVTLAEGFESVGVLSADPISAALTLGEE